MDHTCADVSGPDEYAEASFSIHGRELDSVLFITEKTGIKPDFQYNKGDVFGSNKEHKRFQSMWQIRSNVHVDSHDIMDHVTHLADTIRPYRDFFKKLTDRDDCIVSFSIHTRHAEDQGGFSIDNPQLLELVTLINRLDVSFFYNWDINQPPERCVKTD